VLEDPGGETLDRFLPGPMEMTRFLRFAIGIATALILLSQKVSAVFETNHVFGEIHFSACEGLG
jgi:hypothetical protein